MDKVFEKQGWHLAGLAALLAGVWFAAGVEGVLAGELWGIGTPVWLGAAVLLGVGHQVYVMLVWRLELHHKWISSKFGEKGFAYYGAIFLFFLIGRPLVALAAGIANSGSLPGSRMAFTVAGVILLAPVGVAMHSVLNYFGIRRAMGIDHFDPAYREIPFVKQGIYKYVSNAMYTVVMLGFWAIALLTASKAALVAAAFNHLYIWVHYYTTEKPDMKRIYGEAKVP